MRSLQKILIVLMTYLIVSHSHAIDDFSPTDIWAAFESQSETNNSGPESAPMFGEPGYVDPYTQYLTTLAETTGAARSAIKILAQRMAMVDVCHTAKIIDVNDLYTLGKLIGVEISDAITNNILIKHKKYADELIKEAPHIFKRELQRQIKRTTAGLVVCDEANRFLRELGYENKPWWKIYN